MAAGSPGYDASYFAQLVEFENCHFWFRSRNALIVWAIRRYFPQFQSFLDVGCGTGFVMAGLMSAFPSAALTGSEIFSVGLQIAAERVPTADFVQMDATKIPYDEAFDVVGAFDVIEHIEADELVLSQMRQALKPGGGLLITVPQHPWLWSASDTYSHHVRRYRAEELATKVRRAGFNILRSTSFVSMLLPAMVVSRLRSNNVKEFDPSREFKLNGAINKILGTAMAIERLLIQFGISLPAGGSRLLVAQKW